MSDSSRVSRELIHHASVTMAGTRGNDHSLLSALYNLRFGWHYNWTFPCGFLSSTIPKPLCLLAVRES